MSARKCSRMYQPRDRRPGHVGTTADSPAPDATEAIRAISVSARAQNHS